MTGAKSLNANPQWERGEPWRRARLVQRASPHLGEADQSWRWGWAIALGGMLAVLAGLLLFFV
jgi:hypothetical protein